MSAVWKCDFPECAEVSDSHEKWYRVEEIPSPFFWIFLALPLAGNAISLVLGIVGSDAKHLCEKHSELLGWKPR